MTDEPGKLEQNCADWILGQKSCLDLAGDLAGGLLLDLVEVFEHGFDLKGLGLVIGIYIVHGKNCLVQGGQDDSEEVDPDGGGL